MFIKNFARRTPVLFCILFTALTAGALLVIGMLLRPFGALDPYVLIFINEVLLAFYALFFVAAAGQSSVYAFSAKTFFKGLLSGLYMIIAGVYSMTVFHFLMSNWDKLGFIQDVLDELPFDLGGYVLQSPVHIAAFLLSMLLVGFAEESLFRGVVAERLLRCFGTSRKGVVGATVLSGVLFGLLHLTNGIHSGIQSALVQTIVASFMGMVFAVIFFKSHSLWPSVFLHAFIDFSALAFNGGIYGPAAGGTLASAISYTNLNLIGAVPYIIMVLILLRKNNIKKIAENYSAITKASDASCTELTELPADTCR